MNTGRIVLGFGLGFGLLVASLGHAGEPVMSQVPHFEDALYYSKIHSLELSNHMPADLVQGGKFHVDFKENRAQLMVQRRANCPEGMMCTMVMPAPIVAQLEVKSVDTDECGNIVIRAEEDRTPVDGGHQTLVFKQAFEGVTAECGLKDGAAQIEFTAEFFNRQTGQSVKSFNRFTADALKLEVF